MRSVWPLALALTACAGTGTATKTDSAKTASLYDRLGGKDAIAKVVDDFLGKVGADQRINARFANTDLKHLNLMLVDQICQASGGPCKYTGKDMKTSHAGLKITDDEFNALVEDLQAALKHLSVPEPEQKDLIGALGPMKPDIVNR
jgi:hemoglobin